MIDFHVVAENLKDSLDEHRQKTVVFCAVLVFMAVLGILSFALVKEVKKTAEIKKENDFDVVKYSEEIKVKYKKQLPKQAKKEYVLRN